MTRPLDETFGDGRGVEGEIDRVTPPRVGGVSLSLTPLLGREGGGQPLMEAQRSLQCQTPTLRMHYWCTLSQEGTRVHAYMYVRIHMYTHARNPTYPYTQTQTCQTVHVQTRTFYTRVYKATYSMRTYKHTHTRIQIHKTHPVPVSNISTHICTHSYALTNIFAHKHIAFNYR